MTPRSADVIMQNFKDWLMSVDGRHKNERSAQQCSRQVLHILKYISPGEFRIDALFDRISLRTDWLGIFDKIRQAGTVRTYLNSMKRFFEYVLCDKPKDVPIAPEESHRMITCVTNWSSTYKKQVNIRKFEKQADDLAKLLTEEELHAFDNSELVDECRATLKKLRLTNKPPLLQAFTSCRDYIVASLILSNASRPGAIRNMTLKEFERHKVSDDGVVLVSVKDHKTASTSGHRMVLFTKALYDECHQFVAVRNMLHGIGTSSSDPVFVSWAGRPMSSALVGDQFASFFQRATTCNLVERQGRKLTATLVRKSFVSKVHGEMPELKKDLANMMCHSEATASRSYFLEEKAKNVLRTFGKMQESMRSSNSSCNSITVKSVREKEVESGASSGNYSLRQRSVNHANEESQRSEIECDVGNAESVVGENIVARSSQSVSDGNCTSDDESVNFIPPTSELGSSDDEYSGRRKRVCVKFQPSDERLIRKHFKNLIEKANSLVRMDTVLGIIKGNSDLIDLKKDIWIETAFD